jgi:hypothetical protein
MYEIIEKNQYGVLVKNKTNYGDCFFCKYEITQCNNRYKCINDSYYLPDQEAEKLEREISPETITLNDMYEIIEKNQYGVLVKNKTNYGDCFFCKYEITQCNNRYKCINDSYYLPDQEAEKLESEISPETITINDLYVTSEQLFDCQDELKASQKELIDLRVELRVEKEKSKAIIKYLEENIERCKNTENHYKMVAKKRSSDVNWAMGQAYQNVLEFIKNQK